MLAVELKIVKKQQHKKLFFKSIALDKVTCMWFFESQKDKCLSLNCCQESFVFTVPT